MADFLLKAGKATGRASTKGGELISYIPADGKERLWQGDPAYWRGQSPLLFPIVGSATEDRYKIAGQEYTMTKHGFAQRMEFTKARQGEDFIELFIGATPDTKKGYPFDFTLRVAHAIHEEGFSTTYTVDNDSDRPMPFCLGGHPGFVCPLNPGESLEDYQLVFPQVEDGENSLAPKGYIITGKEYLPALAGGNVLPLRYADFDAKDALILTNLRSRQVKLVHRDTGRGIEFSFPKFEVLGVWTMPGKRSPYVCLEPWSGIPALAGESGNFEDKPYVHILNPGQSFQIGYSIAVI